MRRYLLDTPLVAAYLNNRAAAVTLVPPWIAQREAATSILVYGEVTEYLQRYPNTPGRQAQLRALLAAVHPYFLTYPILEQYALIRRRLRPPAGPGLIGDIDALIAATALARDLTLVTTASDFARVPGLRLQLIDRASLSRRAGQ